MGDRCPWAGDDPAMIAYHDEEWGMPVRDEVGLFEALTLEGAQAGLSWRTVLHRRDGYREVFAGFDPDTVAAFESHDIERLVSDPRIIRHRGKVTSTITNARAVVALRPSGGLPELVWGPFGGRPVDHRPLVPADIPSTHPIGDRLARELVVAGFRFVGPTTVYAFCQAIGLVNDHLVGCPSRRPG